MASNIQTMNLRSLISELESLGIQSLKFNELNDSYEVKNI